MATFTARKGPRGLRWRVQVRRRGRAPVSRTFPTRAEAKAWAIQEEARARAAPGIFTVKDALDRFVRDVVPRRAGGRWEKLRLEAWARQEWAAKRLSAFAEADVAAWRDRRLQDVSDASVAREMALLSTVLETARREWGWIAANPCRGVRRPSEPPPRRRGVTQDEIDRLVLALGYLGGKPERPGHEVAAAFLLAIETGMRAGELLGLTWPMIDLERRVAHLPRTKNGDRRDVPLSTGACAILEALQGRARPSAMTRASRSTQERSQGIRRPVPGA